MKHSVNHFLLILGCFLSVNVYATSFSFSGTVSYRPDGASWSDTAQGTGNIEYDFSAGSGYGIDTYVAAWGSAHEIYRTDASIDCQQNGVCYEFYFDNLVLNDIGNNVIRWDADIFWEMGFFYVGPGGGWITITPLGNGQYDINPYDYTGTGTQEWSISARLNQTSSVPIPPAVLLLGTGFALLMAISGKSRGISGRS